MPADHPSGSASIGGTTDVASGQITQAQADAEKAEITQRATDQVNGSLGTHR